MPEDPVRQPLLTLAEASFPRVFEGDAPGNLIEHLVGRQLAPGALTDLERHPSHAEFLAAIENDATLAAFSKSPGAFLSGSLGSGQLIEPARLPALLIRSAAAEVIAVGGSADKPTLRAAVASVLDAFRSLVAGEEREGFFLSAFDGLNLTDDTRFETPWGTLRSAGPNEAAVRFSSYGGRAAIRMPTVMLARRTAVRYSIRDPKEGGPPYFDEDAFASWQEGDRRLSLAALLGVRREQLVMPRLIWSTAVLPALDGSFYMSRSSFWPDDGGEPLGSKELDGLGAGIAAVEKHYDPLVDIAVNRTLSAIAARDDRRDALIDAVMAWENLFGFETETTFRVTGALAYLLEPANAGKRRRLQAKLAAIYDARSKLVHGQEVEGDVNEHARRAIRTAVEALRSLFFEVPELISKTNRGTRLLMGYHANANGRE